MAYFENVSDLPMFGHAIDLDRDSHLNVSSPKSLKILSNESGPPLVRLDFEAHHGKPENHLQFGHNAYTGRYGDEAKDLFNHILLTKLGVDLKKE